MASPVFFAHGSTPNVSDSKWMILQRILGAITDGGGSSGTGGLSGTGSPEGVVTASPGTTYWDTVAETLWVKNTGTGSSGWFNY